MPANKLCVCVCVSWLHIRRFISWSTRASGRFACLPFGKSNTHIHIRLSNGSSRCRRQARRRVSVSACVRFLCQRLHSTSSITRYFSASCLILVKKSLLAAGIFAPLMMVLMKTTTTTTTVSSIREFKSACRKRKFVAARTFGFTLLC